MLSLGEPYEMSITRNELVAIMYGCDSKETEKQFDYLEAEIENLTDCPDFRKTLSRFKADYRSRWSKACRIQDRFLQNNKNWLEKEIVFTRRNGNKRGRPEVDFECSSERSKRLKTKMLRNSTSTSVLSYATQMRLRLEGSTDAAKVLKEITSSSPARATKYKAAYQKSLEQQEPKCMSGEDALAILVSAKLSRYQYDLIRSSAPDRFPSYKIVQTAKKKCFPDNITISETSATVPLQDLLNHTVQRLIESVENIVKIHFEDSNCKLHSLCLYSKWGFDGSSGHSSYKQAFHGLEASDSAVFITCTVPVRLTCGTKVIWQNPSPASTVYCRPMKIEFLRESAQVSVIEKKRVDDEINALINSTTIVNQRNIQVSHKLIFSMIDGKVCNALTDTKSTQKCFLCGATSNMFNQIDEMISRTVNSDYLAFGLSVLHGWIRMFECILHLAYKLPLKKWQARGSDKTVVAENKSRIQKEFRDKCGLIVDTPKPGFGNTNDGNTARRFFKNAELSAEITKVDLQLIKKIHIVMIVVASGHEIDIEKFRLFSYDTARLFSSLYPWYNMPPTMHKFLIHGPEIISSAPLPIGQLSEEAQEARNKDFKKYREHNSRKCSRSKTNEDIFRFFFISSDPVVTSKRKIRRKKVEYFPSEALQLLKAPSDNAEDSDSEASDASDA